MRAPLGYALIALIACLSNSMSGCRSGRDRAGVTLSVSVGLLPFMQSQTPGGGSGGMVDFPALEVFNGAGEMVFLSHDAGANAALLKSLPASLARYTAMANRPALSHVISSLPGLEEHDKQTLLQNHLPTVVAISLEGCEACELQETTLTPDLKKSLALQGMNSLVIEVSRPH